MSSPSTNSTDQSAPTLPTLRKYKFVFYTLKKTPFPKDPLRNMAFVSNYEHSRESDFLSKAKSLLNLNIQTLEVIIEKGSRQDYPNIKRSISKLQNALGKLDLLSVLTTPLADEQPAEEKPLTVYFSYETKLIHDKEANRDIYNAVCDFFTLVYLPYSYLVAIEADELEASLSGGVEVGNKFFPNSDVIGPNDIGVAMVLANGFSKIIKNASPEEAQRQYNGNNSVQTLKFQGKKGTYTELFFDRDVVSVKTAEEFVKKVGELNNARVIQVFLALWAHVQGQKNIRFYDTPVSDILKLIVTSKAKVNFTTQQRRDITKALELLHQIKVNISYPAKRVDNKGKEKAVMVEDRDLKIFHMSRVEYAVKKEYQGLPQDQINKDQHCDTSVINRFSGQLIPGNEHLMGQRAHIYVGALARLDVSKDRNAMVLGYHLATRFNQELDKGKPLSWDRRSIIDMCQYQKTNKTKPAVATQQIKNVFEKLKSIGVIGEYKGLTNIDTDFVLLYPPKAVSEK